MIELIKDKIMMFINILLGRKADDATGEEAKITDNNPTIKTRQNKSLILILLCIGGILLLIISIVQERRKIVAKEEADSSIKVEVAAESVDVDKLWPNRIEEEQRKMKAYFDDKMKALEDSFAEKERLAREESKAEMDKLNAQLAWAKTELNKTSIELERVGENMPANKVITPKASSANITSASLSTDREFDKPKSINEYIPEGAYVSGYTLTGLAVSTGLNTPTENATPIVIRLTGRGNLPASFKAEMSKCRILGSSYGDLSSERAKIRLEKLVCTDEEKGLIITTDIAGTVYGPDGMDGIKGKIVATSSRHIRNALVGGVIGGLANSAKGQDSVSLTGAGVVNTKKKGFGQMAGEGVLSGTSNAADKVADYYLRQAEAMSPVLTVPGGVQVDAVFTKGVYFGELGMRKKIKDLRTENEKKEARQEVNRDDVY